MQEMKKNYMDHNLFVVVVVEIDFDFDFEIDFDFELSFVFVFVLFVLFVELVVVRMVIGMRHLTKLIKHCFSLMRGGKLVVLESHCVCREVACKSRFCHFQTKFQQLVGTN